MWTRVWLLACSETHIPHPGDTYVYEIGPESILVVRQEGGEVRAFYNTYRHRGTRLCEAHREALSSIRCPYHGWEWKPDGEILRVSDPRSFPQGLPRADLALRPVGCERWGGFVWITMNPAAPPLRTFLGSIADDLAPYRTADHTHLL